jgi:hypothetical protein
VAALLYRHWCRRGYRQRRVEGNPGSTKGFPVTAGGSMGLPCGPPPSATRNIVAGIGSSRTGGTQVRSGCGHHVGWGPSRREDRESCCEAGGHSIHREGRASRCTLRFRSCVAEINGHRTPSRVDVFEPPPCANRQTRAPVLSGVRGLPAGRFPPWVVNRCSIRVWSLRSLANLIRGVESGVWSTAASEEPESK